MCLAPSSGTQITSFQKQMKGMLHRDDFLKAPLRDTSASFRKTPSKYRSIVLQPENVHVLEYRAQVSFRRLETKLERAIQYEQV